MKPETLFPLLACPCCKATLTAAGDRLACRNPGCTASPKEWPVVNDVPVLFDENRSIFSVQSLALPPRLTRGPRKPSLYRLVQQVTPSLSRNFAAERNAERVAGILRGLSRRSRVLIIGCGDGSPAARVLATESSIDVVNADVRWTPVIDLICDGQDLPFADAQFDAVLLQGVLEHVLHASKVVTEVHRVLAPGGLIYSEYPFLQPTHGGAYDFTRLTFTGHRMLWRDFELLDAGACCGPGMALANCIQQFARSLMPNRKLRALSDLVTNWAFWWLKYFDRFLANSPAALDGASAFYFLGRRSDTAASDQAVLASYRGAQA
ncbi:MAG TPA: class I SAM-dependent methyltransferase [Ramlibacter sp.]|jgi:SAM-dependent methyltransferase|nr:class I SAM-dependent methyltransferase [Ramlibacter sp.]